MPSRRRPIVVLGLVVGLALLLVPLLLSDMRELWRTATSVRPAMLGLPVAFSLLAYAAMARSYQGIANAADTHLPFYEWLRITIVSCAVNYVVTSAGLSGFAVRMYLLTSRGVSSGRAVLVSLVQTCITNFTLLVLVVLGFAALLAQARLSPSALAAASFAVFGFTTLLSYAVVLVYHPRLRRRTLLVVLDLGHRVAHRLAPSWTPPRPRMWRFQHNLNMGLEFLLERKQRIIVPTIWIVLDWLCTLAILWAAFRAVGHELPPGVIAVGFAIGVCLSFVSLVPGGLGVMESSMVAVFVSLSTPLEPTVVAVLMFRIAYYILPLLLSFFLFPAVMRKAATSVAAAARLSPSRI